ncbi:UDP-D-galactose:(glucosyl)lipopolysaccharide-1%2 C6-D-galactosyltransferase [Bordetella ansorpii]|uniref:UDP-D-galactose:(Glucosyl)lipopolysaccharide-1,6-D-galactosyltransferase n=1 Tax=Bordetella ansorpii TaxID=288768 RepID=A0A146AVZ3_9BORD|nr:glycosyltransferase family 4 protein [Bordetella ansorpii]CZZ93927.1 UDP-D-galactose:(glucosyl)lipopolysaccharide-1%2 C6-D-galactosyltransferase [Bordetella ansorpii]
MTAPVPGRDAPIDVLVFMKHFSPGFKVGGPLQSVLGLIAFLPDTLSIRVIALNRDHTDLTPYPGIATNRWQRFGSAQVYYCASTVRAWRELRASTAGRTLYLQSCFSPGWSMMPLLLAWLGVIRPARIVVAPRGELSDGALSLRSCKKLAALAAMRWLGLHRGVRFQATSQEEAREISARLGVVPHRVVLLRNLPPRRLQHAPVHPAKVRGGLRMVFVSRVSPKKNLYELIDAMAGLPGAVTLDVYGPVDDARYFASCRALVAQHGLYARVRFHGGVHPARVGAVLVEHDVFVLPTKGENFGHAIYEALAHGVPVVLSDRTPWRGLWQDRAGVDVDLAQPDVLRHALARFVEMDDGALAEFRAGAEAVARRYVDSAVDADACRRLFGPGR